jgi:hypothetical protein
MNIKKLLIIGGGDLCLQLLKLLAPSGQFVLYLAGRDLENLTRSCNMLRVGCLQLGKTCTIYPVVMDLAEGNVEDNSATLSRIRPDIIFNGASLRSWRSIVQLSNDNAHAFEYAGFGPWLPMQLAPAYELMRAVKHSGVRLLTVNAAFPDAVNAVLYKVGMAPDTGAGGIANLIPALRLSIARLAMTAPETVQVRLVAQQYFAYYVASGVLPPWAAYRLRYAVNGVDCTGEFEDAQIFRLVCTHFRSLGGININFFNAISAAEVLENLHSPEEIITHAPGPNGLPGGYPVRVGMGQVLLALPYEVPRAEAISVNQLGLREDGIDALHADGSVTFASQKMAVMEELLGFYVGRMPLADVHQCAYELNCKFREFIQSSRQKA